LKKGFQTPISKFELGFSEPDFQNFDAKTPKFIPKSFFTKISPKNQNFLRSKFKKFRTRYSLYYDEKGLGGEKIKQAQEDGGYSGGGGGNMAMGNNNWNNGGYNAPQDDFDYEIPKGMAGVSEDQIRNMSEGEIMVRVRIPHHFVWQLIGKKGAVVKEMRQATGAHFNFDDLPECSRNKILNSVNCVDQSSRFSAA